MKKKTKKIITAFIAALIILVILFFLSIKTGSIDISYREIIEGLFFKYNEKLNIIYDLRFPRIFIAIIAGAAIGISGVLLQSVMKNPLTDPGIIGISSSSAFLTMLVAFIFPNMYMFMPIISVIGGIIAYLLIYSLAWDDGAEPTRLILTGVALNMTFIGLKEGLMTMAGGSMTNVQSIIKGNIAQKSWQDLRILIVYTFIFFILAFVFYRKCNLLLLDEKTIRSLGVNVDRDRMIISLIAIVLVSVSTSVVGIISFLGLCVPHIARIVVGNNHKYLIPFSAITGSIMLLFSDTAGRIIAAPYEIQASVIMSIIGGPFFIFLLKKGGKEYGN